jgi:DNA replication and repair protein RecF
MIISQASRSYFEDLQEYRRILRQRNRILMDARKTGTDCLDLLEPWDDGFVNRGARIIHRRSAFEKEFLPYIVQAYDNIAGRAEIPSIKYFSNVPFENGQKLEQTELRFKEELKRNHNTGLRLGSTPSGTHRDELSFTINDMDIRKYASQGQHKTFLLALKIAEFHYLKERCAEIPILLLDDVFSELDEHRSRSLLSLVESLGQPFITATSSTVFNTGSRLITPIKRYVVRQGTVIDEKTEETYRRSIASSDSN